MATKKIIENMRYVLIDEYFAKRKGKVYWVWRFHGEKKWRRELTGLKELPYIEINFWKGKRWKPLKILLQPRSAVLHKLEKIAQYHRGKINGEEEKQVLKLKPGWQNKKTVKKINQHLKKGGSVEGARK